MAIFSKRWSAPEVSTRRSSRRRQPVELVTAVAIVLLASAAFTPESVPFMSQVSARAGAETASEQPSANVAQAEQLAAQPAFQVDSAPQPGKK